LGMRSVPDTKATEDTHKLPRSEKFGHEFFFCRSARD
jgi:hypothetical protein